MVPDLRALIEHLLVDAPTEEGLWCPVDAESVGWPVEVNVFPVCDDEGEPTGRTVAYAYHHGVEDRTDVSTYLATRWLRFDVLGDAFARAVAERDALRSVIEGRTAPPSDEEIKAHAAAGGRWAVSTRDGSADLVTLPRAVHLLRDERAPRYAPKRWVALDADCRPCAWPVVNGGARG